MSVVDLATGKVTARVKIGDEPEGVTVTPDGREVYVTCEDDNEIFAVDTATLKVVGRMKTAGRPRSVAFTKDGNVAFVTDENAATITVLDRAARAVTQAIVIARSKESPTPPRPMGVVLTPGWPERARLTRPRAINRRHRRRTRTVARTIENVGDRPWGIEVSADGTTAYTANGPSADVAIIDLASATVKRRIATGGIALGGGDTLTIED